MAARRERGMFDPDARRGREPVRPHHLVLRLRRRPRGGRQRRGLLDRRHPAARQPGARLRRQPHLDRGRHQRRLHRGRRQALRGLRLARPARRRRRGPRRRRRAPSPPPRPRPTGPRSSCCARSSAGPRPNKQNTGAAHGSALGADEVAATKEILGFDPEKTFDVAAEVIEHTRKVVERGQEAHAEWQERVRPPGSRPTPRAPRCSSG